MSNKLIDSLQRYTFEAFANLISAKLRSFLAILGILVGTGSVVALLTCSELATQHALAQFKTLGTNLLAMSIQSEDQPHSSGIKQQFLFSNMQQLTQSSKSIVRAAPYIDLYKSISLQGHQINGPTLATTQTLAKIAKIRIAKGRFISLLDKTNFYCVIGYKIAQSLHQYGVLNPIGKQIKIGHWLFTIIGVAKPWQQNLFIYANINNGVIIPLQTAYILSKRAEIRNILIRLQQHPELAHIQAKITKFMKNILPNKDIDFRNPQQIINIMSKQQHTFTWLLGAIGGISLLVGGIGVMNIMLVSVVERKREIGIRMAIGARCRDIRRMFLIEAVILTVLGGIIGIILGMATSYVFTAINQWAFHILWLPAILGFVVSLIVGLISGFYPAYRASQLNPIDTLQSE